MRNSLSTITQYKFFNKFFYKNCFKCVAFATILLAPSIVFAQGAKSVSEFEVDGIKVLIKPSNSPLVSVVAGFEGGLIDDATSNPDIAQFAAELIAESGSSKFPKEELRKFNSKTSTSISGDGGARGVTFSMNCTRNRFDEAWSVFTSLITNPLFDAVEHTNMMNRRVIRVNSRWSRPDPLADLLADSLIKMNHKYLGKRAYEKDVRECSIQAISDYYKKISERSRMLVVVVGKITKEEIQSKMKNFSSLPLGSYAGTPVPPIIAPTEPKMEMIDKQIPTTYVQCNFVGPSAKDKDAWALRVGSSFFRDVLFREVRTKRNLSYAPGASASSSMGYLVGSMSVSSTNPDSAIAVMRRELENLKTGNFSEKELNDAKSVYTTMYYMQQMTNSSLANGLYSSQRTMNDWRYNFSFDAINAVTKSDVQKVYAKYATNFQVGIVGKLKDVTKEKYMIK